MNDGQRALAHFLFLIFFIAGLILGHLMTESVYQTHAIRAGVGYYDPQTSTFKYRIVDKKSGM
jgi:hypothetical protein